MLCLSNLTTNLLYLSNIWALLKCRAVTRQKEVTLIIFKRLNNFKKKVRNPSTENDL